MEQYNDNRPGILFITIISATLEHNKAMNNMDPYVRIQINQNTKKTKTCKAGH
jgi:hypothetical protein